MAKYISEKEFSGSRIVFETEVAEEFGDLELFGVLMQFKEMRLSFWARIGTGGSVAASPLIYRDTVYFGACDKNFYALTLDGIEKWRFKTNGPITMIPSAWRSLIYVGSSDGNLYALDWETGQLRWKFETNGAIMGPLLYQNTLYTGSEDGNFYALDAASGKLLWKFATGGTAMPPLVKGDRLYFGYVDHNLYCLTLDGRCVWKFAAGEKICAWYQPAYWNKTLYFGCYDKNLYALGLDGRLKWKRQVNDTAYPPVVWEEKVYFGSRDFNVYCLSARDGKLIWKFRTGGFVAPNMVASRGRVYFGCHDNNLYCLDTTTGKEIWRFKTKGIVNFITIHNDRIYFGSWDCHLYCLDMNGNLVWKFHTTMSTPAPIHPPEATPTRTATVTWAPATKEEEKYKGGDVETADYGQFSGKYIDITKSDYLGRKKRGYM